MIWISVSTVIGTPTPYPCTLLETDGPFWFYTATLRSFRHSGPPTLVLTFSDKLNEKLFRSVSLRSFTAVHKLHTLYSFWCAFTHF